MDSFNGLGDSSFLIVFMVGGHFRVLLKGRVGVGRCLVWGCVSFGGRLRYHERTVHRVAHRNWISQI